MSTRLAIPTVLLSTTAVGCADPLVGVWSADSVTVEGETINIPYEYGGYMLIEYIELDFDTDLLGTWTQKGDGGSYSTNLEATKTSSGSYTIKAPEGGIDTLNCTLSHSFLDCASSEEDANIVFSKGSAKE